MMKNCLVLVEVVLMKIMKV